MLKKQKNKKTIKTPPESKIKPFFRITLKTILWIYYIGTLVLIGGGIGSLFVNSFNKMGPLFQNTRSLFFIITLTLFVLTLIGAIFKLIRKRHLLPLIFTAIIFAVTGQVYDYVTRNDVENIPLRASGMVFSDTLSIGNVASYSGYVIGRDAYTIPADNSKYEHVSENPIKIASEEPVSTFSIDVDTSAYANVRSYLNRDQLPPTDAIRVEEMINYFPYDYKLPKDKKRPFAVHTTLTESPWKKGNKLLHIGIKGYEQEELEEKPLNLVFLIDTSGSMFGTDRLDLIKKGFSMLVDEMDEDDMVSIVTYAGSSEVALQPTSGNKKQKIKSAINSLSANGGTWGEGGLKKAYELIEANYDENAVNRILLATDGDFNLGNTRDESLTDYVSRQSKNGIYLSILNVGQNNYNDSLMQKLAQNGNGIGYYLDSIMEAKRVLSDDIKKTLFPIADDVKIQVEFNPAQVSEYRLIGYETRLLNREDFNNDQVDAGEINAGHTVTAIYEITPAGSENKMVDDLRYGQKVQAIGNDKNKETAFVRVRYKLPGEKKSNLIQKAVTKTVPLNKVSADVRFSIAVAGFGQKLRNSKFVDWDMKDIRSFAKKAKGKDEFEYRDDFISLIKKADALMK